MSIVVWPCVCMCCSHQGFCACLFLLRFLFACLCFLFVCVCVSVLCVPSTIYVCSSKPQGRSQQTRISLQTLFQTVQLWLVIVRADLSCACVYQSICFHFHLPVNTSLCTYSHFSSISVAFYLDGFQQMLPLHQYWRGLLFSRRTPTMNQKQVETTALSTLECK